MVELRCSPCRVPVAPADKGIAVPAWAANCSVLSSTTITKYCVPLVKPPIGAPPPDR